MSNEQAAVSASLTTDQRSLCIALFLLILEANPLQEAVQQYYKRKLENKFYERPSKDILGVRTSPPSDFPPPV